MLTILDTDIVIFMLRGLKAPGDGLEFLFAWLSRLGFELTNYATVGGDSLCGIERQFGVSCIVHGIPHCSFDNASIAGAYKAEAARPSQEAICFRIPD